MMMMRQGDVLLVSEAPPEGAWEEVGRDNRGRLVLAEGEMTGHAHAIAARKAAMYMIAGALWLHMQQEGELQHEEHGPLPLDPGWYKVLRQREYVPGDVPRQVLD